VGASGGRLGEGLQLHHSRQSEEAPLQTQRFFGEAATKMLLVSSLRGSIRREKWHLQQPTGKQPPASWNLSTLQFAVLVMVLVLVVGAVELESEAVESP